jgi:hypothetical protein
MILTAELRTCPKWCADILAHCRDVEHSICLECTVQKGNVFLYLQMGL